MADKGIIFSAPMVLALLAGRKTQTRRLCAWANNPFSPALSYIVACDEPGWFGDEEGEVRFKVPYAPGDRLYVRECAQEVGEGYLVIYRADYPACVPAHFENVPKLEEITTPWRPSIHMPRKWSRLWLQVADVRVQRVAEISEEDAIAEGIEARGVGARWGWADYGETNPHIYRQFSDPRTSFQSLWNSLHTKPGETWADSPWVVAVTFTAHRGNIDRSEA